MLLPATATLDALVAGGDRRSIDIILADRRLAPLAALRADRLLDVPEPRHAVLVDAIAAARAVRVLIRDPDPVPDRGTDPRPGPRRARRFRPGPGWRRLSALATLPPWLRVPEPVPAR